MATSMMAVKNLMPGMIIGEAVLSADGKVLLGQDTVVTPRIISLLLMWHVNNVFILNESENDRPATQQPPKQALTGQGGAAEDFINFLKEYNSSVASAARSFDSIYNGQGVPVQDLKDTSFAIYSTVLSTGPAIMDYLLVSDHDLADEITRHSVMVAFFSTLIGRKLKLPDEQMNVLILAALLHDIGRLVIPKDSGAHINSHVVHGGKLLQHVPSMPQEVLLSILQHHEYMDGSGYPIGAAGDKAIHLYARIIAVADFFHKQAYSGKHANPFPAIEAMAKEMLTKLDQSVCQPFIRHVRDCLMNAPVLLSDQSTGQVIFFNAHRLDRPIIKTAAGTILDLAKTRDISIAHLIVQDS